jgi:hypothetical protein
VTPAGTQRDLQVLDGTIRNVEWDGVWAIQTTVHDSGWTAEIFIPWATLRYDASERPWDFNVYRVARRTNEISAWHPWPRNFNAYRLDFAGQLVGLAPPPPSQQAAIRPYLLGRTTSTAPSGGSDLAVSGEVTWSPTTNTALDLTVNTDFAQTDVDRPVINLTRFSIFLPERRQFFLEGASLFSVVGPPANSPSPPSSPGASASIPMASRSRSRPARGCCSGEHARVLARSGFGKRGSVRRHRRTSPSDA